ncbi:MAG: HAD family hydrolase [Candidatus Omnitrophica bacterium]|nr:HAD family hydrolase [Candidatus Omnitrophota bacterium]
MKLTAARSPLADVIQHARVRVFDFDGTLVDSTAIKWRAFDECFAGFPEHRAQIQGYCRSRHHTPRREKFQYVYEEILGLAYTPEIEARLLARFDRETTKQIIAAREIPGAAQFLAAAAADCITGVLSSTPHETLLHILERRGWRRWFEYVQGAPVHKADWLARFKARYALTRQELVFFGDTGEDAQAAQEAGCAFVAVGDGALGSAVTEAPFALAPRYWLADFTALS